MRRPTLLLAVLCAAFFLDALDVSMINVALPSIQHALGMSVGDLQWVVTGYVLGFGGFLLLGGRTADVFGRRRVFLIALTVFFVASAVGGLAGDGGVLIASRFAKGIAAGFTAPAGLALISSSFAEGAARNRALAAYTATGSAGFTFGLIAGGLLSEAGWRLVFFVPALVAALTLAGAIVLVPADAARARGRLDVPGALTVTGAMLLLVFTLSETPGAGWGSARTLLSLLAVALLLAAFAAIERRVPVPIVPPHLLASWPRVRAYFGVAAFVGGWAGAQFVLTLYLQDLRGWSALETAAAFWPCGVLGLFVAPRLQGLVARFGLQTVLAAGLVLAVATYALLLGIGPRTPYWTGLFPSFALIGIAFGLCFATLNIGALAGVAEQEHGVAGGLVQTAAQFGTALMLAITAAVSSSGPQAALLVPLIAAVAALLLTVLAIVTDRGTAREVAVRTS